MTFQSASVHLLTVCLLTLPICAQKKQAEPQQFTTNCKACHAPQTDLVGPSLVEMARLYPRDKRDQFIAWCVDPGKKRADKAQMPSMAHIPKKDLVDIHKYILDAAKGLKRVPRSKLDPYKDSKFYTERPRVFRSFIPDTGPASVMIALPTKALHNIVWDTDQCTLRYITTGEPDGYPYWKSNGNSEIKPGDKCFTEELPVFPTKGTQYLGYQISKDGYPTFNFKIGEVKVSESYSVENGVITRIIQSEAPLPKHQLQKKDTKEIKRSFKQEGNSLTIRYAPSNK